MKFKKKVCRMTLIFLGIILLPFFYGAFFGVAPAEEVTFGITFSQKQAEGLGLDWQETYLALLDDLQIRDLRLVAYWDLIESASGKYDFSDLDFQILEAEERGAEVILALGQKVPRWPECHLPTWTSGLTTEKRGDKLLTFIQKTIEHYRGYENITVWQVENEPFFRFGECPRLNKELLKKEIALVRRLDSTRPIMLTESGELSTWFRGAKLSDLLGVTMYRKVFADILGTYFSHFFPPSFYSAKANLVKKFSDVEEVIGVELQGEPWTKGSVKDISLEEQFRSLDFRQFQQNIKFARRTNLKKHYLWGGEWWYWLKKEKNEERFWEEARKLFGISNS